MIRFLPLCQELAPRGAEGLGEGGEDINNILSTILSAFSPSPIIGNG